MTAQPERRLIIDTDTAADDCFALLLGSLDPLARLEAVTIVAGNVPFDLQVRNALIALGLAGRAAEVPVHLGARTPLVRPWVGAEEVHGDGVGGGDFPVPDRRPETEPACAALARIAREHPGEVDVVAIGPLTNIALATTLDPEFPRHVRRLYVMGGCNNGRGNITPAAEYNFYVDPEAARRVFEAGFEITLVDWRLSVEQGFFTPDEVAGIAALDTPIARFFVTANRPTLEFDMAHGVPGSTHCDSLTMAVALHPELVVSAGAAEVRVETQGELTRGYSMVDLTTEGRAVNARVVTAVDRERFYAYVRDSFSSSLSLASGGDEES